VAGVGGEGCCVRCQGRISVVEALGRLRQRASEAARPVAARVARLAEESKETSSSQNDL
jgi:hypothetical protein